MKKPRKIYMDYAAATPIEESVERAMKIIHKNYFSNPSSIHEMGVEAKNSLIKARSEVATIFGVNPSEIIFTSGATESNNFAILGVLSVIEEKNNRENIKKGIKSKKIPHIVTTNIEHSSVLEICKYLEKSKKAQVTYVGAEENGIVDPRKVRKALRPDTVLVSVMYANSEIGTIQPLKEIGKVIRHYNKNNSQEVIFHTDATQAINYLPIEVLKLGVDLMSVSSVKFYGPRGMGALYIKKGTPIAKIIHGGDQQYGLRSGSYNLPGIVGMALALRLTEKIKDSEVKRLTILRDYFFMKLLASQKNNFQNNFLESSEKNRRPLKNHSSVSLLINGDLKNRLPNNVNITVPNIPSDLLVIELSARGIMCSAKSACKSGDSKASYVLQAINPKSKETDGSLRFSLGRQTTKNDIDFTLKALGQILTKLRKWYY